MPSATLISTISQIHFSAEFSWPDSLGTVALRKDAAMLHRMSRRESLVAGLLVLSGVVVPGCGTIFHPERKGQPAGPLDWEIVALDAIGLLFFFIPGVIAFAVDFNNGSIYLPAERRATTAPPAHEVSQKSAKKPLVSVPMPEGRMTRAAIEKTLKEQSGHDIRLVRGEYQTKSLESLDQFWTMQQEFEQPAAG